jgi:RNA polymerase sigma factor (sigma-70 family)
MGSPVPPLVQRPAAAALGDDTAFRERVRARDPQALAQVFQAYWTSLYAQARLILPPSEDPEGVAGDVMLRLIEVAPRYDPARPLYPWLAQVCAHLCVSRARRFRPTSWFQRVIRFGAAAPAAPSFGGREARDALGRALATLPRKRREALVLRYLFGLEDAEIATVHGVTTAQVRRLLLEGLSELREGPHGEDLKGFLEMAEDLG